jgi:hypothetical protein
MIGKIVIILYSVSLIISYIECSACSQDTNSTTYEECLKLRVTDESTQVCTRKSSSSGCMEKSLCTDITYISNDEICSKLSVSPDKVNSHMCTSYVNLEECQQIIKRKYGLPEEEELMVLKNESSLDAAIPHFFSMSFGCFFPIEDCISQIKCIETNICTEVRYGGTDEKCAKLTSKAGTTCIKDPLGEGCIESGSSRRKKNLGSFLNISFKLMVLLFIFIF